MTECGIEGCGRPRHQQAGQVPTFCKPHDVMLRALQGELRRRSGSADGAADLLRRIEAARMEAERTI